MTRCDTNDSANHIDTSALRLLLLLLVAMLVPLSLCAEANAQGSRWIDNVGIGLGAATPPVGATDGKLWEGASPERTHVNVGQRNVFLHIARCLSLDPDALEKLTRSTEDE